MAEPKRLRYGYSLDLTTVHPAVDRPAAVTVRSPAVADRKPLARLMDDAYQGTIDHDGESLAEARLEVAGYDAD